MITVGLTGNIGSGKSTVSRLFSMMEVPVYYADAKGKYFLTLPETIQQLRDIFGDDILDHEGNVDRQKLAAIVFNDSEALQKLNAIIHPLVRQDFKEWIRKHEDAPYVIQEAAILFETGQARHFDRIIVVSASEELRIDRVCRRDNVTREEVLKRAQHQMDEEEKIQQADFVIANNADDMLLPQVHKVHQKLQEISKHGADR